MHLDQQLLDTRRDNERLHVRLRDASDSLSKLTDSYETLATSFSVYADQTSSKPREDDTGKSQAVVQTQLNRAQYPNVRYWCKRAWREFTRESKGLTITTIISEDEKGVRAVFHFIQCADGQLIDKETFGRVSQAARGKFSEMATKGVLPSSWDKALWSVRTDFERDMEHAFPVLALCENHWKANEVAKLLFPGFKQNNRSLFETPPAVTVKEEPSVAAATSPATGKRKFAEMDDSAAKSMESPIPLSSHSPSEQRKGKAPAVRMPNRL
ncbi:hypothetical protein BC629DRAFT_1461297 [Irpex lacteus]|nr:hypothetical protein BC629DRAFT_1461297 [Irpex lacteus]